MKKMLIAVAAAGTLLAAGVASAEPIQLAQWSLSNGFRGDGFRGEPYAWDTERAYPADARGEYNPGCRTMTIHEQRGGETVARQVVRC
jgi:hypothetical protein